MRNAHERLRAQIRAGRELLGLNQSDLATAMDVSLSKISRVESGITKSGDSLLHIKKCLEGMNVRFTQSGVEIVENRLEVIEGEGCYMKLLDDVLITLKNHPDKELLIMFASDKISPPEVNDKYRILRQIGVQMRQLIRDGDTYIMGQLDEYQCIPKEYFTNIVTVVYADKVAQVNGGETRVTIHIDNDLSRRERLVFQYFWDTGSKPKISTAEEKFDT